MAQYRITRQAQDDLQNIWDYTVKTWSINQAEIYIDGLLLCFDAIADGTIQGKSVNYLRFGYKKTNYRRHIVFFRVGHDMIHEIIRVLHVSMDIENRLTDE